ncbi:MULTISPECIES: porin family protein [Glaesserella]|uniref:DUF560 domain-containing protein n=1 Tax=Glaesserella australis TaxID=2094024 RepID=A0A328C049_9PAST|nr:MULTISPECIES: porin family protein [Glaesserella]AUI66209.1 hypothetical protein CJD39_06270 [Glaesserella sp. 15-184]RAL19231.1 hypothetical protein C5N92_03695 [Glaesserella australis]
MRKLFYSLFFCSTFALASSNGSTIALDEQLKLAIYQNNAEQIQSFLSQYQQQAQQDRLLISYAEAKLASLHQDYALAILIYREMLSEHPDLTSIRMELAKALFADRQDSAARLQFDKVKSVKNLPASAYQQVNRYIDALNSRNNWQIDASVSYLKTDNVENVSSAASIENTGFIKGERMLPQKARGFSYNLSVSRDVNLIGSHYIGISNETNGKSYWDNHQFDELFNRTFIGYSYKKNDTTFRLQPFYEKRWYGSDAFHWSNGMEVSYSFWLAKNWQNQTVLEYEKRSFFKANPQGGDIRTASTTVIWYRNPKQLFYIGSTYSQQRLQEQQYSSDIKNFRLGWLQEYAWGISTKLNLSYSHRKFKDQAVLGGILPLGKVRKDEAYAVFTQVWKRDWHLWGITPKLNIEWKKQKSNLDSLYSYKMHNITVSFERTF